jgi:ABC-type polysaccharide/polyol phosphate transport system ATPase subunit
MLRAPSSICERVMTILELNGVSKSFLIPSVRRSTVREHALDFFRRRPVEELQVLRDVSVQIRRGESFGIMGRNGCGKSTLLKIAAGIYQADRGRVIARAPITPVLELGVGWNPDLDALDNILLVGSALGLSLRELRARTDEILAFAGLQRFANLKVQHYSSGMASRLAFSVAFTAVREILIVDEIFAVGDAEFTAHCQARYRQLSEAGHTIVIVSHDPAVIANFCQRAVLVEEGRIVAEGNARQVARQYLSLLTTLDEREIDLSVAAS